MPLYMLVQITYGNKKNIGLFDTHVKALALQTAIELEEFTNGSLVGVNFEIEEWYVK